MTLVLVIVLITTDQRSIYIQRRCYNILTHTRIVWMLQNCWF